MYLQWKVMKSFKSVQYKRKCLKCACGLFLRWESLTVICAKNGSKILREKWSVWTMWFFNFDENDFWRRSITTWRRMVQKPKQKGNKKTSPISSHPCSCHEIKTQRPGLLHDGLVPRAFNIVYSSERSRYTIFKVLIIAYEILAREFFSGLPLISFWKCCWIPVWWNVIQPYFSKNSSNKRPIIWRLSCIWKTVAWGAWVKSVKGNSFRIYFVMSYDDTFNHVDRHHGNLDHFWKTFFNIFLRKNSSIILREN